MADIEWGGMFASVAGTFALLSAAEKAQVVGIIVNRFRGLAGKLTTGTVMLEDLVQKPVLGVLGYYRNYLLSSTGFADGKEISFLPVTVISFTGGCGFKFYQALTGLTPKGRGA